MNHNVYDTQIIYHDGSQMYFDVLVPTPQKEHHANQFALKWLASINIDINDIALHKSHFCHNAITSPAIEEVITQQGYAIIKSKGCPGYYL